MVEEEEEEEEVVVGVLINHPGQLRIKVQSKNIKERKQRLMTMNKLVLPFIIPGHV